MPLPYLQKVLSFSDASEYFDPTCGFIKNYQALAQHGFLRSISYNFDHSLIT